MATQVETFKNEVRRLGLPLMGRWYDGAIFHVVVTYNPEEPNPMDERQTMPALYGVLFLTERVAVPDGFYIVGLDYKLDPETDEFVSNRSTKWYDENSNEQEDARARIYRRHSSGEITLAELGDQLGELAELETAFDGRDGSPDLNEVGAVLALLGSLTEAQAVSNPDLGDKR